jgi:hypothetical protein
MQIQNETIAKRHQQCRGSGEAGRLRKLIGSPEAQSEVKRAPDQGLTVKGSTQKGACSALPTLVKDQTPILQQCTQ